MIRIGIDPDLTAPGVAVIENGAYQSVKSMSNPDLFELIATLAGRDDVVFYVEDVNAISPTYFRGKQSQAVLNSISQRVGMVKAAGTMLVHLLQYHNCQFELVKPLRGTLKKAKKEAEIFQRLTGWQGRTNQDSRDAAMLIFRFRGSA